ncbi:MAG: FG-GAP repeat protein [Planctomycetes bacterium]|nr:FG-GAP repeat protein [Planctomycetota bacterium]
MTRQKHTLGSSRLAFTLPSALMPCLILTAASGIAQCPPSSTHIGFHNEGVGVTLAADGDVAVFGHAWGFNAPIHARRPSDYWERVGFLSSASPNPVANGRYVALRGNVAVSSDPSERSLAGTITIAELSGSTWTSVVTLRNPTRSAMSSFGSSLAISSDGMTIAVGAPLENGNRGVVYVYRRANTWTLDGTLTPSVTSAPYDYFGTAVTTDGNRVIVGAPGENGIRGALYVFDKVGSTWSQTQRLTAKTQVAGQAFGGKLEADGNRLVVGTLAGMIEMARSGTSWSEVGFITNRSAVSFDLAGSRLAVGRDGDVEVYEKGASGWSRIAQFGYPDPYTYSKFGTAVALTTHGVLVGAPSWDDDGFNYPNQMGAVFYYDLSDYGKALVACGHGIHAQFGGSQRLLLDAPARAGQPYLVLGSVTGTGPLQIGSVNIPLSFDFYLEFTAAFPNSLFIPKSSGVLDAKGRAETDFVLPRQLSSVLLGVRLHHAFVTFTGNTLVSASNEVTIEVNR